MPYVDDIFELPSSNLSKECANAKDPCNKLPDKSAMHTMHPPFKHSQGWCALQWEMHFSECYPVHCLALLRLVVWQAIVRSILQALTGPETCWHKALTDILSMFSPNRRFHRTVNLHLCLVRHYKALDILCMFSLTLHTLRIWKT